MKIFETIKPMIALSDAELLHFLWVYVISTSCTWLLDIGVKMRFYQVELISVLTLEDFFYPVFFFRNDLAISDSLMG